MTIFPSFTFLCCCCVKIIFCASAKQINKLLGTKMSSYLHFLFSLSLLKSLYNKSFFRLMRVFLKINFLNK